LPRMREVFADHWSASSGGRVARDQVAITSGCNQAFTAAVAVLAEPGDNVIITTPWYFNHKMWLDMSGVEARALPIAEDMQPDTARATRLIDARTRALVLITPNNPTGSEYDPERIMQFYHLARERGIALIIDETYRDFRISENAPHAILADPDWDRTLIGLYSFSKSYRLTGHRVGALIAAKAILDEVEKYLDTVTICPNQIAQHAALFGLENLGIWLAGERQEILRRKRTFEAELTGCPGWHLLGCGAYFAYVGYEGEMRSDAMARHLLRTRNVLALPDTMFLPERGDDGGAYDRRSLRFAYANIVCADIVEFSRRLGTVDPHG
ncbi:MAG: aminotransferase, partial [Rhodobacteraceae bacterium]|nr:aminotransferase [Paracoccaceae bacterium]